MLPREQAFDLKRVEFCPDVARRRAEAVKSALRMHYRPVCGGDQTPKEGRSES